jgi:ABC-type amino acid transport substrate-binding protein
LALGLAAVALIAVVAWLAFRFWPEGEDPTWEQILARGTLLVCTDPSWPPFESIEEGTGRIVGLDADLAGFLAEGLAPGLQVQFVPVGFDSLYDALLSGRCDLVLSALPHEPLRTEDVGYSMSYLNGGTVLVTSEGGDIAVLEDLAGRAVGVEWGFVFEGDHRQRSFLQGLGLRRYPTPEDALAALQAGEVEAALVDRISALYYIRECQALQIVGQPLSDLSYVIPVRPDSFRLLEEIDRVLLDLLENGTLESLQDTWF